MLEKFLDLLGAFFGAGAQIAKEAAQGAKAGVTWTVGMVWATMISIVVIVAVLVSALFFGLFASTRIYGDVALGVLGVFFSLMIAAIGTLIGVFSKKHRMAAWSLEIGAIVLFVTSIVWYALPQHFPGPVARVKTTLETFNRSGQRAATLEHAPHAIACQAPYTVDGHPRYWVSPVDLVTYDRPGDDPNHPGVALMPLTSEVTIELIKMKAEHETRMAAVATPEPAATTPPAAKEPEFESVGRLVITHSPSRRR